MAMTVVGGGSERTSQIEAICFDAFGTLAEINDKRRPFRAILCVGAKGRHATDVLTSPLGLRGVARELAIEIGEVRLLGLEHDLAAECRSIQLRPGIETIWALLRRAGLRIGICSNLAMPYAKPLLAVVPGIPDALVLSFEVGLVKPQLEIYQLVCERLGLEPHEILFVGDTVEADVAGPRKAGLFAMHIDEFEAGLAHGIAPGEPQPVAELFERVAALSGRA